ncbi:MAG: HNH endonuclease signature motif containing protein [Xanthobacteraceae bacterium]
MAETEPNISDVKKLFARSGNQCGFPRCTAPMAINDTLLGEICHIKGRRPKSARYDPAQTPAERNAYANLILLCPTHHTVVDDDEEAYTVERLIKMKADHEAKATPIDDAAATKVASSFLIVSSVRQSGGITAHQIRAQNITLTNQVVDPVVQRRQLEAREKLWEIISKLRSEFSMVLYIDNIYLASEINEFFAEGKHSRAMSVVSEYQNSQVAAAKMSSVNPDKERPFIPHKVWSIVFTIRALYGRTAILIQWSFERRHYVDWRTDSGMDQILRGTIPAHVVEEIKKRPIGGLTVAIDYLQNQFLAEAGLQ